MKCHYIVLEGIDGSGKTSVCSRVSEDLLQRGFNVLQISEPSHSDIGKILRNQVQDLHMNQISMALLYASDSYDIQENIQDKYDFIISDRNYLSTIAYQMTYIDKDWLLMLHRFIKQPDAVFYLNVSVEEAIKRIKSRNNYLEYFETYERLSRVKDNYARLISDGLGVNVFCIETDRKNQFVVAQEVLETINLQFSL